MCVCVCVTHTSDCSLFDRLFLRVIILYTIPTGPCVCASLCQYNQTVSFLFLLPPLLPYHYYSLIYLVVAVYNDKKCDTLFY